MPTTTQRKPATLPPASQFELTPELEKIFTSYGFEQSFHEFTENDPHPIPLVEHREGYNHNCDVRYWMNGLRRRGAFVAERDYSDETAQVVDLEIRRIVDEAYEVATSTLKDNWEKVTAVADALLKHEILDAQDVNALMRGEKLATPTVSELLEAEAQKASQAKPAPTTQDDEEGTAPGMVPSPA